MKNFKTIALSGLIMMTAFVACQRDLKDTKQPGLSEQAGKPPVATGTCNPNAYTVKLESKTLNAGNWSWIWSVQNPNPGNGTNGTSQDLSHWGMQFAACLVWTDIVGAAYSTDGGVTWVSFTPTYKADPSQSCVTTPVLKFNVGTTGTVKTFYKLILSKNYSTDPNAFGYYKSGSRMPCCTFKFNGVGCPIVEEWCAYSQGYWFPSPNGIWCQNVVFGANSYTQAQGDNIWATAPNNSVAKKAFTQASALQLSRYCVNGGAAIPASIIASYNTLVTFLSGLSYNDILTGTYSAADYPDVNAAQGAIGDWIPQNHCTEDEDPIFTRPGK